MKLNSKNLFSYSAVYVELLMTVSNTDLSAAPEKKSGDILWRNYENSNVFFFFQGPNNDIMFLELDLLETECPILSPTPLANCTVRSFAEHVSTWTLPAGSKGTCSICWCQRPGRFPSKCYITVTAYNHPITCNLLADLIAFMSWRISLLDFFHVLLSEQDRSLPT